MKRIFALFLATSIFFGLTGISNSSLIDRGGGLIYDTVLDVTWLQDANYAFTSEYDDDGDEYQRRKENSQTSKF